MAISEKTATNVSCYKKGIAILFKTGISKINEPIRLRPDITNKDVVFLDKYINELEKL
jgi:hypothetical protein